MDSSGTNAIVKSDGWLISSASPPYDSCHQDGCQMEDGTSPHLYVRAITVVADVSGIRD
ncbi:hypothetical protein BS47DRAFT_1345955 [Hydnum rufescens UP504]|uniref:Uncharacterized protein n=1 Tax=Hydnum rufescens UP504 TaxID=1448309 RepID=A0A9P6AU55_9AGAM|nr:hypothetical protein BS47DRAFT_1345955 [Hydnum rufescens UP504]